MSSTVMNQASTAHNARRTVEAHYSDPAAIGRAWLNLFSELASS